MFQVGDHVIAKSKEEIIKAARECFPNDNEEYIKKSSYYKAIACLSGKKFTIININKRDDLISLDLEPDIGCNSWILLPQYFKLDEDIIINNSIPFLFGENTYG